MSDAITLEKNRYRWKADFRQSVRNEWLPLVQDEKVNTLVDYLDAMDLERRKEAVAVVFTEMESIGRQREEFITTFANSLDQYDRELARVYKDSDAWSKMVRESRSAVKKLKADDTIKKLWEELLGQSWWLGLGCVEEPNGYNNWNNVRHFAFEWSKLYSTDASIFYWLDRAFEFRRGYMPSKERAAEILWTDFSVASDLMLGSDGEVCKEVANEYNYRYYLEEDGSIHETGKEKPNHSPRLRVASAERELRYMGMGSSTRSGSARANGRGKVVQVERDRRASVDADADANEMGSLSQPVDLRKEGSARVQEMPLQPVSGSSTQAQAYGVPGVESGQGMQDDPTVASKKRTRDNGNTNPAAGSVSANPDSPSRRGTLRSRRANPFTRPDQAILEILGNAEKKATKKDKSKKGKAKKGNKTRKGKTRKVRSPTEVPETQDTSPNSDASERPRFFGPKVSETPQVRPVAQETIMLPTDYVHQRKLPCGHWRGKSYVISDLGIGRFQDDGDGVIDGRRVIPINVTVDGAGGLRPMILIVPRFQGWEETAELIRDAVTRSHCPSNTLGFVPDHGVVTEENMDAWFPEDGGFTAVCLPGKPNDASPSFKSTVEGFGLSGIPISFQDMAWAPEFMEGEATFKFDRPKATVEDVMKAWPDRYEADLDVELRHALYCLETTTYSKIPGFKHHPLAQECAAIKERWEDEASDKQVPQVTKSFPTHLPFDDPDDGRVALPWSMANSKKDSLKGTSAIEGMMDKFIRWFLVNSAGSWSPVHTDGAASFTVGEVQSGYKLWIIIHKTPEQHTSARRVDCLLLKATDRLIIRPGVMHCVYTVANSVMTGSHFYRMSNLEEIMHVRRREAQAEQASTNEVLPIGHAFLIWYGHELCSDRYMEYAMDEEKRTMHLKQIRKALSQDIFEGLYCPSAESQEVRHVVDVLSSTAKCASSLLEKMDKFL